MNEKIKPKNPDYTASAVKLTNSPEVKGLFHEWLTAKDLANEAKEAFDKVTAELPEFDKAEQAIALLKETIQNLEAAIKEFGSYQDIEQGLYALRQKRQQISYDPQMVKEHIPDYADKILSQVDTTVLRGLITGKLVTKEQADKCAIVKESVRFVIEAVKAK